MKLIFVLYLMLGTIVPNKKDHPQDRQTYTIFTKDKKVIEYAYKEEVIEYLETGTFEYNEDLE